MSRDILEQHTPGCKRNALKQTFQTLFMTDEQFVGASVHRTFENTIPLYKYNASVV